MRPEPGGPAVTAAPTISHTPDFDRRDTTMSTPLETRFETTGPISLKVELQQGDLSLRATAGPTTVVRLVPRGKNGAELAERFTVESRGDAVVVLAPKERGSVFSIGKRDAVDVEVDLPEGSILDVRSGSGDVRGTGRFGDTQAVTGSGDIAFDDLGTAELKSGSGDLTARAVRGELKAKTGSGDIKIEAAHGAVDLLSGSGDVSLRRAEAPLRAKTGSGDVTIGASAADVEVVTGTGDVQLGAVHGGEVRAKTGTGDVVIGVAAGVAAYLDLNTVTGDVRIDLSEADGPGDAEAQTSLAVHSGSGDIKVRRAQASLA
ncbi:DUF4097 and DUF4098 domain-containing protein YvlB [Humibacillus xanthopallidus]|uniref:DUF4097 and DUF4098 domain-containing protein YvlB n=2 Tax=Humibacillus xanthopallidus TaxID=412689 RepID=A0A543HGS1_9MICO|nr:DUF4097 and DUF4098 domain-containing protein YvlB [Humibacillus xanthopallidus]